MSHLLRNGVRRQGPERSGQSGKGRAKTKIGPGDTEAEDEQSVAKGFIRGTLWGAGLSFGTVTLLSVMASDLEPQDGRSAQAYGTAPKEIEPGGNRTKDGVGPTVAGLATEEVPAPKPDTLAEMVEDALTPAAVPQTGNATALSGTTPEPRGPLEGISVPATQAPSVRYTEQVSLSTPSTEPEFSISADPAQPQAPEVVAQVSAFDETAPQAAELSQEDVQSAKAQEPTPEATEEETVIASAEILARDTDPVQPISPGVVAQPSAFDDLEALPSPSNEDVAIDLETATEESVTVTAALAPDALLAAPTGPGPLAAQSTQQPAAADLPDTSAGAGLTISDVAAGPTTAEATALPEPEATEVVRAQEDSEDAQVTAETVAVEPQAVDTPDPQRAAPILTAADPDVVVAASSLPDVGQSERSVPPSIQVSATPVVPEPVETAPVVAPAPAQKAEVRVNRLPSLGGSAASAAPAPRVLSAPAPAASPTSDGPPLERFNVDFSAPAGKPLMAVILIDEGQDLEDAVVGIDAVKALPYPVSFAVNALLPDAPARMAKYRSAGFEVLASLDLPEGATASDAEVNVSVALEKLPEVIGILEGTGGGVQTSPMAGRQVASILAQTGHGFVTQKRGLNTVQQLAEREGVPARSIYRDLDGRDQSEVVIRRFMDQAAFRAGQDDGVVMLGRLRPETLAALLSWTRQDRASTVAMAPVSALLLQSGP